MRFETRPLPSAWPFGRRTMPGDRRWGNFRATTVSTMSLLERELRHLEAGEPVIIEAGYQPHEIRADGKPRANARPSDPAVILSFKSKFGPLRYGTDIYREHWHNLRALALALEALRAVDRYGVSTRGQQYQGWLALPAPGESLSAVEARKLLEEYGGLKAALRATHPDTGAHPEDFSRVQAARLVLGL